MIDQIRPLIAHGGTYIYIINVQFFLYILQCGKCAFVGFRIGKGNIVKSGKIIVVIFGIIKAYHVNIGSFFQVFVYFFRFFQGNVCYHHIRGTVCDKLFIHQLKTDCGLRGIRKVFF